VTPAGRPGLKSPTVHGAVTRVASTIGNRAMGRLVQRAPTGQPATSGPKRLPITQFAVSKEEIEDAEAWMAYVAQRGLTAQPTVPLPDRYADGLSNLNNAIWGDPDVGRKRPLKEAKEFVKTLRSVHDDVLGKGGDYSSYTLADTALKRAEINTTKAEGDLAFAREGAYQIRHRAGAGADRLEGRRGAPRSEGDRLHDPRGAPESWRRRTVSV
jgi:hypothetical protein